MNKQQIKQINDLFTEALPFILDDKQYAFIQSLPQKQRICFIMRNAYGHSYKQIAENLEISVPTAKRNVSYATAKCNKAK